MNSRIAVRIVVGKPDAQRTAQWLRDLIAAAEEARRNQSTDKGKAA